MTERKCGDGCKGCRYRKHLGGPLTYCDYFGETGELRGCPPGKGCKRYKKATAAERLRMYLAEHC